MHKVGIWGKKCHNDTYKIKKKLDINLDMKNRGKFNNNINYTGVSIPLLDQLRTNVLNDSFGCSWLKKMNNSLFLLENVLKEIINVNKTCIFELISEKRLMVDALTILGNRLKSNYTVRFGFDQNFSSNF